MTRLPRILATGFTAFPGAPVNPTQALVARLEEIAGAGAFDAEFDLTTAVLPVDWRQMPEELARLGRDHAPDIAVHFGLAASARGFRLERVAENRVRTGGLDNTGFVPPGAGLCAGPASVASSLPLQRIAETLSARGLPVEWSDDAGGYLCNAAFFHACAGTIGGFAPAVAGFVHLPLPSPGFDAEAFVTGAVAILRVTAEHFRTL